MGNLDGATLSERVNVFLSSCSGSGTRNADLNSDGTVDTQDFILFLNLWSNADAQAEWNHDGSIDTQDILATSMNG